MVVDLVISLLEPWNVKICYVRTYCNVSRLFYLPSRLLPYNNYVSVYSDSVIYNYESIVGVENGEDTDQLNENKDDQVTYNKVCLLYTSGERF